MPEEAPQPAPQPQVKNKTKNVKAVLKIVVILEIAIILAGVSFIGYSYVTKDKEETSTASTSQTEKIDTSNWKTYENPNGKFRIKYPSDMVLRVEKNGWDLVPLGEVHETISFLFPDSIETNISGVGIESAVNIEDPEKYFPTIQSIDPKLQAEFIKATGCCNEVKEVSFGGKVGYKLEYKPEETKPYHNIFILLIFGKNQKSLIGISGTTTSEQQSQIVDKIIETFKFTE